MNDESELFWERISEKLEANIHCCPKHGKQQVVFQTNDNKQFCIECIGDLLEKYIKPLEEI